MHLVLVDGSSYIFRAFHALPPLTRKSDGLPLGAVAGFCNMLFKLTEDLKGADTPTHVAVIFDYSSRTFRDEIYADYKAHRPPPPEELVPQFPLTRAATRAFNIPVIELEGLEADDIIATFARQAREAGGRVTIVSSDKDLMQLLDEEGQVKMLDTLKNKWIGPAEVREKFGVGPDKVIDVQALCGDAVDNVPGVPGIGVKTAAELINTYGDLETLLARAEEIRQPARRQKLIDNAELARISKRLVTLKDDVELPLGLDDLARLPVEPAKLVPFLKAIELFALLKRLAGLFDFDPDAYDADGELRAPNAPASTSVDTGGPTEKPAEPADWRRTVSHEGAARRAENLHARVRGIGFDPAAYKTISDAETLRRWVGAAYAEGVLAVDLLTTSADPQAADLVGIALAVTPGAAAYVPLGHSNGPGDMLGGGPLEGQMRPEEAFAVLGDVLEDPSILKVGYHLKAVMGVLRRYRLQLAPIDDALLIAYALDGNRDNSLAGLAESVLSIKLPPLKELLGTGKSAIGFAALDLAAATRHAAGQADLALRLWQVLKAKLIPNNLTTVYETLERPLAPVLARMEARGISVDRQILSRLSGDFAQRAAAFEDECYELAGERFNLGSPKQLGDILFGKMGLPGGTKTKTGAWSTSADILEELAGSGVPLARAILEWRQLTKLKSTYTDALPAYMNPQTGRVHTFYSQAQVLTGRLSSNEPNLQNIPVRTEDGRKIRTAFVASPGKRLISADYSQIELRVLAHIADIQELKDAFEEGLDIHALTASEMFGVPVEGMPSDVRRRAKAINFGIIYGISAFGLANQLGIERGVARDYIATYFERFPGIRDYMDRQKRLVKEQGFVETIFGRKIPLPNANTAHVSERAFIERVSINAPIQGSAADIIRRAMIRMEPALQKAGIEAEMLLQVHDELIFEVPEDGVSAAIPVIIDVMEQSPFPAVNLTVPLKVDAHAAGNWDEAH